MQEFTINTFDKFDRQWAVLTSGQPFHYNSMTISWGGTGTLWGKPVVTVYVRPNRYTYEFMEENEYFTVTFFPEAYRKALSILGTKSGRDSDKMKECGLTPVALEHGITYEEAEATLVCRKIYAQKMDPEQIPDSVQKQYYAKEPVHTMYIGEVVEMIGTRQICQE